MKKLEEEMASEKKCYFIAVDFSKVIDTFKA
jgi:hypothetical protein